MYKIERHKKILDILNAQRQVNTNYLADFFDVSKVTIRRDIDTLSKKGLLCKTHGGAVSMGNTYLNEIPFYEKSTKNIQAKEEIGKFAANMVQDGDIIILDAGSTTLEIAKNLNCNGITVLTNDINIANELISRNIKTIICGGLIDNNTCTLYGQYSTSFFDVFYVNKTFLGCDAIDVNYGISNRTFDEKEIKLAMIRAAEEVIMVTDSSKLNKKVFAFLCEIEEIDSIIIEEIDSKSLQVMIEKGINVMLTRD